MARPRERTRRPSGGGQQARWAARTSRGHGGDHLSGPPGYGWGCGADGRFKAQGDLARPKWCGGGARGCCQLVPSAAPRPELSHTLSLPESLTPAARAQRFVTGHPGRARCVGLSAAAAGASQHGLFLSRGFERAGEAVLGLLTPRFHGHARSAAGGGKAGTAQR